jgi:predicted transcriptional regulator of viral defense system
MKNTRIQIAKSDIVKHFDKEMPRVLNQKDIAAALSSQRTFWRLAQRTNTQNFIQFLVEHGKLKRFEFPFPYRSEHRYAWGDVPLLEVLLSIKKDAYFSHYTAVRMHGLTEQVPKIIYLNHEQRLGPQKSSLAQGRIDAAFSRRPRVSQNSIEFGDIRICLVNGMNTNQLGVVNEKVTYDGEEGVKVRLTNIERTLIDIAVRPIYSGGVFEVQKAFRLAKDQVSVNALAAMLQKIGFGYPYHQAIGYYLEHAGYKAQSLDLLRRFPMDFDFYLANQMGETEYIKEWRLYVPKGF